MSKYNIINMSFWDTYMSLGGSGCTLGLIIAIFLFSKRADYRAIAKLSVGPGIFEINECMTFGLPIVLNPYLVLPFIITPLINGTIGYFATKIGFAGVALYAMPWTTPPIISAWLSTVGAWLDHTADLHCGFRGSHPCLLFWQEGTCCRGSLIRTRFLCSLTELLNFYLTSAARVGHCPLGPARAAGQYFCFLNGTKGKIMLRHVTLPQGFFLGRGFQRMADGRG